MLYETVNAPEDKKFYHVAIAHLLAMAVVFRIAFFATSIVQVALYDMIKQSDHNHDFYNTAKANWENLDEADRASGNSFVEKIDFEILDASTDTSEYSGNTYTDNSDGTTTDFTFDYGNGEFGTDYSGYWDEYTTDSSYGYGYDEWNTDSSDVFFDGTPTITAQPEFSLTQGITFSGAINTESAVTYPSVTVTDSPVVTLENVSVYIYNPVHEFLWLGPTKTFEKKKEKSEPVKNKPKDPSTLLDSVDSIESAKEIFGFEEKVEEETVSSRRKQEL